MNILLIPNIEKDNNMAITNSIVSYIDKRANCNIFKEYKCEDFENKLDEYKNIDVIIVLGGDGTLLGISNFSAKRSIPILGINLGRLGFLAEVERHEINESIDKLLSGRYSIEKRSMINACLIKENGEKYTLDALNDMVVTRAAFSRLIDINVLVNDELIDDFKADGIIFATPTGSTAYSLSAGGPVVDPSVKTLLITPICPHKMYSRTIMVPDDKIITVILDEKAPGGAIVSSDGHKTISFDLNDRLILTKSKLETSLIRVKNDRFYGVLREKLSGKDC